MASYWHVEAYYDQILVRLLLIFEDVFSVMSNATYNFSKVCVIMVFYPLSFLSLVLGFSLFSPFPLFGLRYLALTK